MSPQPRNHSCLGFGVNLQCLHLQESHALQCYIKVLFAAMSQLLYRAPGRKVKLYFMKVLPEADCHQTFLHSILLQKLHTRWYHLLLKACAKVVCKQMVARKIEFQARKYMFLKLICSLLCLWFCVWILRRGSNKIEMYTICCDM